MLSFFSATAFADDLQAAGNEKATKNVSLNMSDIVIVGRKSADFKWA